MRSLAATFATLAAIAGLMIPAALAPAKKGKSKPPEIEPMPLALYDEAAPGVKFSVNVFHANSVSIKFGSHRREAEQITVVGGPKKVVKFTWEALFNGSPRKSCYHIVVTAQGKHGTVTRKRKACRLGQQPEDLT